MLVKVDMMSTFLSPHERKRILLYRAFLFMASDSIIFEYPEDNEKELGRPPTLRENDDILLDDSNAFSG